MEYGEVVERVAESDDAALVQRLRELEGRRREVEGETAVVLAELERRTAYRADEHASMYGLLRSTVAWSDRECRERTRLARLVERFGDAAELLYGAQASVANVVEIARGAANPRCGDQIDAEIGNLLGLACRAEFDDLKLKVRTWERRADMDGAHREVETGHANRNAHVVVWDGVGHAAAQWGETDGLANREIFDRFVRAEWEADWAVTVERHGDDVCQALMPRTDAQRRADAMTKIFARAASAPPGSRTPEPVVNVHVDDHTFRDILVEAELLPERIRDPFEERDVLATERRCTTDTGHPIDPLSVLQHAMEGWIGFVIHSDRGVPIRSGGGSVASSRAQLVKPSCRCRIDVRTLAAECQPGRAEQITPENGPRAGAPTPTSGSSVHPPRSGQEPRLHRVARPHRNLAHLSPRRQRDLSSRPRPAGRRPRRPRRDGPARRLRRVHRSSMPDEECRRGRRSSLARSDRVATGSVSQAIDRSWWPWPRPVRRTSTS